MENYADGVTPSLWAVAGQFDVDIVDLRYSVSVSTTIDFDRRRYRHLEGEEYHRALSSHGLEDADWSVSSYVRCVPGSFCEAFVEFFEDVGEFLLDGVKAIGQFFAEDVERLATAAYNAVVGWVSHQKLSSHAQCRLFVTLPSFCFFEIG